MAMFVIVIGISGVTSAIYWGLEKQDSGKVIAEASAHGELILEQVLQTAPSTAADASLSDRTPLYDPPFDKLADYRLGQTEKVGKSGGTVGSQKNLENDVSRFTRNIQIQKLTPNGTVDAFRSGMSLVTVRIYWTEKNHERHVTVEGVRRDA